MTATLVDSLRHALGALAYRLDKVVVNAPPDFGVFTAGHGVRTPAEIVAHMGDVLAWANQQISGQPRQPHAAGAWEQELARFAAIVWALNLALLDWNNPDDETGLRLLQGPLADAMTHVGQLAMLCRMAGKPIPPEDFSNAPIVPLERNDFE